MKPAPCPRTTLESIAAWAEVSRNDLRDAARFERTGSNKVLLNGHADVFDRLSSAITEVMVRLAPIADAYPAEPSPILRDEVWSILIERDDESVNLTTDKIMEAVAAHEAQVSA